jgi:hypothetical protein
VPVAYLPPFQRAFAFWMALAVIAGYFLMAAAAGRPRAAVYAVYTLVAGAGTVLARYDIVPAVLTVGALVAADRRRYSWSAALLALGTLLKVYPLICLPVLLVAQYCQEAGESGGVTWHTLGRSWSATLVPFVGICAAALVAPELLHVHGSLAWVWLGYVRPTQIESVPAVLLWLLHLVAHVPYSAAQTFHSLNVISPAEGIVRWLFTGLLVVGLAFILWQQFRGRLTTGQAWLAAVALFVATNKVLSPQFILWLTPLAAYVLGWDLLWLAVCVLTAILWPVIWQSDHLSPLLLPHNPAFTLTIALRDAVLVAATLCSMWGLRPWPFAGQASWRALLTYERPTTSGPPAPDPAPRAAGAGAQT